MANFPKEHVVKVRAELDNAVVVRPGDKLVVGIAGSITATMAREMKERLGEQLPGVDVVIIDNTAGFAVYRDDERPVRKVSHPLADAEIEAMRAQGLIDENGEVAKFKPWPPPAGDAAKPETITYGDCRHPALQAIRDRLEQSDEALSAAWLRQVIAEPEPGTGVGE